MSRADLVVPIRDDQEEARPASAAAHEAQEIERGLVGPVGVLEHGERRSEPARELGEDGAEDPMPGLTRVREEPLDIAATVGGTLEHRRQRARRGHGVAGADEHPRRLPGGFGDPADERGLADTGLTSHEDKAPSAGGRVREQALEVSQECVAFEQFHVIEAPPRPAAPDPSTDAMQA
jgi:hypothetical protein